jgi:hypothetical protein
VNVFENPHCSLEQFRFYTEIHSVYEKDLIFLENNEFEFGGGIEIDAN